MIVVWQCLYLRVFLLEGLAVFGNGGLFWGAGFLMICAITTSVWIVSIEVFVKFTEVAAMFLATADMTLV